LSKDSKVDSKNSNVAVQQRVITGVVRDDSRNSLPGVNVVVLGTTAGAITDMDGRYSIPVPAGSTTLQFSFIGMESQDVIIGNRTTVDVVLKSSMTGLDEVVVVGYGTTVKSSVTGSISTVATDQLQTFSASTNITDAMGASVSGAFVVQQSGRPGELSNIYLRGPVSVNGGKPLYVVDGVPMDDLGYNFNPDDIENVSVLKDASAAAIYGAKAAGGVILVTTKRGVNAPVKVRANASFGIRNVLYLPDLLRRDDYLRARELFGTNVENLYGPRSGWSSKPDTDWLGEAYRTGSDQNYGISLTGGNNTSTFFVSGGYNKVTGVYLNNDIQRYTLRANSDHKITDKLKFSNNIFFNYGIENPPGNLSSIFRVTPLMAVYDEKALDNRGWGKVINGYQGWNRIQQLMDQKTENNVYNLTLNGTLSYEIIEGLTASVFGATDMRFRDNYSYTYPSSNGVDTRYGNTTKNQYKDQSYIVTYTLNYNKTFGFHSIRALAGYEARKENASENGFANSQGYLMDEPWSSSMARIATSTTGSYSMTDVHNRILSQFGRAEYEYAGKYLFTGNIRRDGYGSKFAPDYKYGVFPGASVGWNISREDFFNVQAFDLLKIRAGYGLLGNAVGNDFAYASYYEVGHVAQWDVIQGPDTPNTKQTGLTLANRLANQEIRWESVATTNIGLDGVLWDGRLSFNIDYYSRQTKDMIYNIPIALSAGTGTTVQANVGKMSNKGWELFLQYNEQFGDFGVSIGVNLGNNKNELISLSDEIDRLFIASGATNFGGESGGVGMTGTPSRSEPGRPLGMFYGLQTAGVIQNQEEADNAGYVVNISAQTYAPRPGDLRYVDQNGDKRITSADYTFIGNPWPKLTHGFTLGANWKQLIDVKAIFGGTYGNDIFNFVAPYEYNFFSDYSSTAKIFNASFFGTNGVTDIPRNSKDKETDADGNRNWTTLSDYHVKDGSYIQLKTLALGFTLPKTMASRLGVANAKLTFSGENLFILTKYDGLTPIVAPQNRSILAQGMETPSGRYPLSRLYSVSLSIEF
jgi:TonB-linked SusC/RagA family outer membrane protein